ncbi:hypothetical protein [Myroides injenensis]|uniref:hypothetical protein n=1 Tax=Myroides injenensis TaxID=1183151 RepID=UPI00028A039D|nr:hypothetical protein [Myroides injenensis]
MGVGTKSLILQFCSFALFFVLSRIALQYFTELTGFWLPLISAVVATILAPQFKVFKTDKGDKICVKWIFMKKVKVLN